MDPPTLVVCLAPYPGWIGKCYTTDVVCVQCVCGVWSVCSVCVRVVCGVCVVCMLCVSSACGVYAVCMCVVYVFVVCVWCVCSVCGVYAVCVCVCVVCLQCICSMCVCGMWCVCSMMCACMRAWTHVCCVFRANHLGLDNPSGACPWRKQQPLIAYNSPSTGAALLGCQLVASLCRSC